MVTDRPPDVKPSRRSDPDYESLTPVQRLASLTGQIVEEARKIDRAISYHDREVRTSPKDAISKMPLSELRKRRVKLEMSVKSALPELKAALLE